MSAIGAIPVTENNPYELRKKNKCPHVHATHLVEDCGKINKKIVTSLRPPPVVLPAHTGENRDEAFCTSPLNGFDLVEIRI